MAHGTQGVETAPITTSVGRAAIALGLSSRKVWQLVLDGEIPSFKIGSRRLIRLADLEAFAQRKVKQATR